MIEVDAAFDFIRICFIELSPRDFYIIARGYALNYDWQQEELKKLLANDGWQVEEDGRMYK